jgi:hypothetical protein
MSDDVSQEEIESLAEKLDVFAASLPDRERDILAQVLSSAADSAETSGFASSMGRYMSATSFSMAMSVGPAMQVMGGMSTKYFPKGDMTSLMKE